MKRQKRIAGTYQIFGLEIVVKVAKFLTMTFARCSNGYLLYGRGLGCNMLLPPPHPYSFIIKLLSLYNMLIFIFLLLHRKLENTFYILFSCYSYLYLSRTFQGKKFFFALNLYLFGTDSQYFQIQYMLWGLRNYNRYVNMVY